MKKIWLSAIASAAFVFMSCASSGPHVDAFNRAQKAYNDGKDDKAIAEDLGITQYKVAKYLEQAKEKIKQRKSNFF